MINKGEGYAHSTWVDRYFFVLGEVDYHGGKELEVVLNASDKYDLLVLSR